MTKIFLKRVYLAPSASDGFRILVDRLWPQGLTKAEVDYNLWVKNLAPSTELREWFHQDRPGHWTEFQKRYSEELRANTALIPLEEEIVKHPVVTLLYASKDTEYNNAVVIAQVIEEDLKDKVE